MDTDRGVGEVINELTGISAAHEQSIQKKARKRIIESIGKNMDLYGITLSTGLLYGLMFFFRINR